MNGQAERPEQESDDQSATEEVSAAESEEIEARDETDEVVSELEEAQAKNAAMLKEQGLSDEDIAMLFGKSDE